MPRCPNGTRRNKKTGNCEPTAKKSKRCAKGTRKNKKTGKCDPVKKSPSLSSLDTTWRIVKINYVFPTQAFGDNKSYSSDSGIMNIESVFFENSRGDVAEIMFEDKKIVLGKKGNSIDSRLGAGWEIEWDNSAIKINKANKEKPVFKNLIAAGLNSDVSQITFSGRENDEENNHSTEDNISKIESEYYGKYVKINASGLDLEVLMPSDKGQVLQSVNNILRSI